MGKSSKRKLPDVQELLDRPWCYYCERDFDDLRILTGHQKARHFKCNACGRRLNTAGGLHVHMQQVHKETLETVDNALPSRLDPNIEIFGMEGIPAAVAEAHKTAIIKEFHKLRASFHAASGNNQGAPEKKKPRLDSPEDIKARLAEHKAKRQVEKAKREAEKAGLVPPGGSADGENTPDSNALDPMVVTETATEQSAPLNNQAAPFINQAASFTNQAAPFTNQAVSSHNQAVPFTNQATPSKNFAESGFDKAGFDHGGFGQGGFGQGYMPTSQHLPFQQPPYNASPFGGTPTYVMPQQYSPPQLQSAGPYLPKYAQPWSSEQPEHRLGKLRDELFGHTRSSGLIPPLTKTLPSVSGLPQRPAFDPPDVTRRELTLLHEGYKVPDHRFPTKPPRANHHATENQVRSEQEDVHSVMINSAGKQVLGVSQEVVSDEQSSAEANKDQAKIDKEAFSRSIDALIAEYTSPAAISTSNPSAVGGYVDAAAPRPMEEPKDIFNLSGTSFATAATAAAPAEPPLPNSQDPAAPPISSEVTPLELSSLHKKAMAKKLASASSKLVYSDNAVSGEEKLSTRSRYRFDGCNQDEDMEVEMKATVRDDETDATVKDDEMTAAVDDQTHATLVSRFKAFARRYETFGTAIDETNVPVID